MSDRSRRTQNRQPGPRVVDSRYTYEKPRTQSRCQHSSASKSSSHPPTYSVSHRHHAAPEKYALNIMGPPPTLLAAGNAFEPSILISTKRASSTSTSSSSSSSSSSPTTTAQAATNLIAVATLLTDTRLPLPTGHLRGPRLFDNVHALPPSYLAQLQRDVRDSALGYVSFPALCVARPGAYRLRVSLLRLADPRAGMQDAVAVGVVDTAVFWVSGGRAREAESSGDESVY